MVGKPIESHAGRVTVVSWNYHHGKRHCVSETVKLLHKEGLLERLITNKYEVYDSNLKRIKPNTMYPVKLFHLIMRIKNILAKNYKKTQFREWLFDIFATNNLGRPCMIYLDAERFPLVMNYAINNNITTLCYQRTAHVNYLTSVLEEERDKRQYDTGYLDAGLNNRRLRSVESADFILAHSEFVRDTDVAYGKNEKDIKVVYGCVDTDIYIPATINRSGPEIVLFVGTAPLLKGLFYLLDAWRIIQNSTGDAQLWVVGNKPADYSERYGGLLDRVTFFGHQNDMVPLYQKASFLVQPSLVDAGPKAVTEAMATGMPAIVSNAIGYSEIIENNLNGYVVPVRDHNELAEKIEYCILHPEETKRMGMNARARVQELSHQSHAENVVGSIKSIVQSGTLAISQ